MRKTPSYLKGLAETRARAAGDLLRFEKILAEVAQRCADARAELVACDRLIRKFDIRLNPELIQPIAAWQGRYGKRGALRNAIKRLIRESGHKGITTTELCWALQIEFRLDFNTAAEKKKWQEHTLKTVLKKFASKGVVERLHQFTPTGPGPNAEVGRWRWKSDACLSLVHLQAQAVALGVSVQQCDDAHE